MVLVRVKIFVLALFIFSIIIESSIILGMIILIGIYAGILTLFINYCFGKPSGNFSPYEIFSGYTLFLAKKRLIKVGLWDQYLNQFIEGVSQLKTKHEIITFKNDFKKMVYEAADPFFTWERAVGMCPICTGFWISLIVGIFNLSIYSEISLLLVNIIVIVLSSFLTIRILNKLI